MFRFIVKPVTVTEANEVINFTFKLAKKAALCTGVSATANSTSATKQMAEMCIAFADKANPLNIPVENGLIAGHKKYGQVPVHQVLALNSNVQGHVNDLGNSGKYPYTVKIYFKVKDI